MLAAINWGILNMIDKTRKWHDDCLKGVVGPRYATEPAEGEYRCRREDKSVYAVYFWYDRTAEGAPLRCHIDGKNVSEEKALRTWEYCGAKNCITPENYWNYIDHGQWLDNDAFAAAAANGPEIDPATDPIGSADAEIATASTTIENYKIIDSDEQASRAQTARSSLTTMAGKFDKQREAEKAPHLRAAKEVDARWMPRINLAKDCANEIRTALQTWEDQKREAARKAQAETDRIAREHATATHQAAEAGRPAPPPPPKPVAPNMPAPAAQIRGASGRAASVTVANIITNIDLDKCFAKFRTAPELRELFMSLADKSMKAGICTAEDIGAVIEQKSVIR